MLRLLFTTPLLGTRQPCYAVNKASHQPACFWKLTLTCSDSPAVASFAGMPAKKARLRQTAPG
jgi:hypothetical protein